MKDEILKLTSAVYKVLEFFPESDPLKNRAKEKALAIFENQKPEDVDMLLGYLQIAKSRGWLNPANYLILASEYEKIKKTQKRPVPVLHKTEPKTPDFHISGRQKQILDFLADNEKAQVVDLQKILPDVTKRTIRRDLDELLGAGSITRMGEFNEIFYRITEQGGGTK